MPCSRSTTAAKFYRRRDPEASPFYKLVSRHFSDFEHIYPDRYEKRFGYWRPVIREAIDKFVECGDLRNGFARVRCPECGEEFFVAFSCKQRGCCPSCDQKRALILAHRLLNDVLADVPHRQWVFTIPKRLRVYFRFSRSLLGDLCRAAYETVHEVMRQEVDEEDCVPAMVGAVQTFGDLVHWHPHIHALVAEGVFLPNGHFVRVPSECRFQATELWQDKVFALLLDAERIDLETVASMREWKHSGFSIHNSVRLEAGDTQGIQGLVEYIARCPFSLGRMVKLTEDDRVVYRAGHPQCIPFPKLGHEETLNAGMRRNYQVFDPLDFLASVTQHIPNKGEHQVRYYGWYSNKSRGMRTRQTARSAPADGAEELSAYQLKCRLTWAALLKCVYEVDPLECPKCHAQMKIVGFIERDQEGHVRTLLSRAGLWKERVPRPSGRSPQAKTGAPPPAAFSIPAVAEPRLDYGFFDTLCS